MSRHKDPEYQKKYYLANKEKFKAQAAAWKLANPDKVQQSSARRYVKKKDHILQKNKEWQARNKEYIKECARKAYAVAPEKYRAYCNARRKRVRASTPPWVDEKEVQAFYIMAQRLTRCTGIKHHVDHYYPLRGKTSSGLNVPYNLRVIPASINIKKSNNLIQE